MPRFTPGVSFEQQLAQRQALDSYAALKTGAAGVIADSAAAISASASRAVCNAIKVRAADLNVQLIALRQTNLEPAEFTDTQSLRVDVIAAVQSLNEYLATLP
jgi:hypothetical protein